MGVYDEEMHQRWKEKRALIDIRMATSRKVLTHSILELLETPDQVRIWLEAKQPGEIVSHYQTPDDTVLANFLWDALQVYVMTFGLTLATQEVADVELPTWCAEFTRVEVEHFRARQPRKADWTAEEALTMLLEAQQRLHLG
jgi:hypothetical protein